MKAKTRIKILSAVLVCFALIIAVSVTCYASETSHNFENVDDSTQISSEIEEDVDNNNQSSANAEQNVGSTSLNRAFSEMYEFASRYAAEIISAITFAGTVIIGFAYKKGLIPMLGRVTGNIQNAVVKIKENTEESNKSASERLDVITDRLGCVENSLTLAAGSIERLEEKLESEEREIARRRMMDTVMRSQVDMLYDIFMASALPQYQKDAVGMRVQKMREELSKYEESIK